MSALDDLLNASVLRHLDPSAARLELAALKSELACLQEIEKRYNEVGEDDARARAGLMEENERLRAKALGGHPMSTEKLSPALRAIDERLATVGCALSTAAKALEKAQADFNVIQGVQWELKDTRCRVERAESESTPAPRTEGQDA